MIYAKEKVLFVKIADRLCDDILSGHYQEGDRVASVRELAAEFEVNVNTVLRAFDLLQRDEILQQQRGIGMLVARGARRRVLAARRKDFLQTEMPDFLRRLRLLGMDLSDVQRAWEEMDVKKQ
ncbi:MAG: GntR family transcriptional regulator [Bacteroidaceae bacterium]|nr:GntR family transcriptional regulator [Bacteroidaceae bacterium]